MLNRRLKYWTNSYLHQWRGEFAFESLFGIVHYFWGKSDLKSELQEITFIVIAKANFMLTFAITIKVSSLSVSRSVYEHRLYLNFEKWIYCFSKCYQKSSFESLFGTLDESDIFHMAIVIDFAMSTLQGSWKILRIVQYSTTPWTENVLENV